MTRRALVHGNVQSPIFSELQGTLQTVQEIARAGHEDPTTFDLVIVDGSAWTPEAMGADATLKNAARSGRWILAFNITEEHKNAGLGKLVGGATGGSSKAYMVRQDSDERGRSRAFIVDIDSLESDESSQLRVKWAATDNPRSDDATATVDKILGYLDRGIDLRDARLGDDIPEDLIYKQYFFPYNITRSLGRPPYSDRDQSSNVTVLVTYTIFLNNRGNPQGDFQFVACTVDGQANPTNGTGTLASDTSRVKGWLQANIKVWVRPYFQGVVDWVATSPNNAVPQTDYTTNAQFTVGFETGSGPTGSYTWGRSQSYSIKDWITLSRSSGVNGDWAFASRNPGDGLADDYSSCNAGWMNTCPPFGSGLPKTPNALTKSTVDFHVQQVWKTSKALNDTVVFSFGTYQDLIALWCEYYSPGACWGGESWKPNWVGAQDLHYINLGSVLPVPIKSISFDPNPVVAGRDVVGRIELSAPAPTNIVVELQSHSPNATVLPSVTIRQSETEGTFQVHTNANGLSPGQQTVAEITAFYAQNYQERLSINAPSA